MKNLITILVLVVLAVGGYLLLVGEPVTAPAEEELLTDADFLLDDSVLGEVDSALADVLSAVSLDNEALAAEAGNLENLGDFESPSEIDQYLNEALK